MAPSTGLGDAGTVLRLTVEPNAFVVIVGTALGARTQRVTVSPTGAKSLVLSGKDSNPLSSGKDLYISFDPVNKRTTLFITFEASNDRGGFSESTYRSDYRATQKIIQGYSTYYTVRWDDKDFKDTILTVILISAVKNTVTPNGDATGGGSGGGDQGNGNGGTGNDSDDDDTGGGGGGNPNGGNENGDDEGGGDGGDGGGGDGGDGDGGNNGNGGSDSDDTGNDDKKNDDDSGSDNTDDSGDELPPPDIIIDPDNEQGTGGGGGGIINPDPWATFYKRIQNISGNADWSAFPGTIPNLVPDEILWTDGNLTAYPALPQWGSVDGYSNTNAYRVVRRNPNMATGTVIESGLVSAAYGYFQLLDP
ncbi:hypothetical protein C8R46DRAFT_1252948 [Mycena filopes]|nr:hypothetical protein C8R46DRAFT_1252948 [Mycena filopes]